MTSTTIVNTADVGTARRSSSSNDIDWSKYDCGMKQCQEKITPAFLREMYNIKVSKVYEQYINYYISWCVHDRIILKILYMIFS